MAVDPRVKKYLAKKTRDEKLQELVNQVDNWDLDTTVEWVKYELEDRFSKLSDDELDNEYYLHNDYEIDCELDAEDDYSEEVKQDEGCQCPSLFMYGHEEGCPEKRS